MGKNYLGKTYSNLKTSERLVVIDRDGYRAICGNDQEMAERIASWLSGTKIVTEEYDANEDIEGTPEWCLVNLNKLAWEQPHKGYRVINKYHAGLIHLFGTQHGYRHIDLPFPGKRIGVWVTVSGKANRIRISHFTGV